MQIKGNIDEIRFRNEENGFAILVLDCDGEPVNVVGVFPPLAEGEYIIVEGSYTTHAKFGKQFKATKVESTTPSTEDSIIRYLGSGLLPGIGPRTALAIVNTFGLKSLYVVESEPGLLSKIRGISKAKAKEIGEVYSEIKASRDSLIFLQDCDISLNMSLKIFKKYGQDSVATVKSNPYKLIEDIDGIGFSTADRIAIKMGIALNSDFRIRAGVLFSLRESSEKSGNTYLPRDKLLDQAASLLGTGSVDEIDICVNGLIYSGKVKLLEIDGISCVMTSLCYNTERNIAKRLLKLIGEGNHVSIDCASEIEEFQRVNSIEFHSSQLDAIKVGVNSGVVVITGGPGTGKTTIIKCILSILHSRGNTVSLLAPTGRASKRLSESTGESAKTIHRALMMNGFSTFEEAGEALIADAVIVDEVSMVDIFLLNTLLSRLQSGTRLILVGDKDQLPSVGAGNVLSDMIASDVIKVVSLNQIYRQAESSLIVTNAHSINKGEMPILDNNDSDFFYKHGNNPDDISKIVVEMVTRRLPGFLNIDANRIQVLSALKNGISGTINLNKLMQNSVNPAKGMTKELVVGEYVFREGDKVMHIANNYNLEWQRKTGYSVEEGSGVFNGDMGVITRIFAESGEMKVTFEDGREVSYCGEDKFQLVLSYAITVHKSQGSEFDAVVIPIVSGASIICTRNLLYTAITRAKRLVVLVGEQSNIKRMVDNNYIATRYSALNYFLVSSERSIMSLFDVANSAVQQA